MMFEKKFKIKPDISGTSPVWSLEEKRWFKWERVYKNEDIVAVKKMKDHLLQRSSIYTIKNNVPSIPLRTRPSTWVVKEKLKYLKIKRKDLPSSLNDF
jgi:hypothetical protein